MTAMMEEILIEPTEEWLPEAAAYKRAFEAAGDSMDGTGSRRTILHNGGVYEGDSVEPDGQRVQRYWITL